MANALFIISIIFLILGGILLVWRMLHICFLGEFWNNTPQPLTWGITIVFTGAAVVFAGFVLSFESCPYGCPFTGTQPGSLWVSGGIVVGVGLAFMYCRCGSATRDKPIYYDWATKQDTRGYMSGLDFVAIGMGLAILSSLASSGNCPSSCAEAVVQR